MRLKFWKSKRSLENPQTPLSNPADWLVSGVQGATLTPDQALGLTPIYNAITLISETVAQLPVGLYKRDGKDTGVDRENPLHDLIGTKPHKHYGSFHWRQVHQANALGWGNGYAHIERDMRERPIGLRLLDPSKTYVELKNGDKIVVTIVNNKAFVLPYSDVLHIPAMAFDGLSGKSPITLARDSITSADSGQKYGKQFFTNGASWGSTISIPDNYGSDNFSAMRTAVENYKGKGYSGTLVLPANAVFNQVSMSPRDSQFIEGRQFSVLEAARMFNLPADFLSYLEKSSFNNTTEMSIRLVRYTITPWLVKWENELNLKLLTNQQRQKLFFKFNVGGLLRGTQKERYDAYQVGINAGFLLRNEARGYEDLNQIDGLSEPLTPLNMISQEDLEASKNNDDTSSKEENSRAVIAAIQPQLIHLARQLTNTFNKVATKEPEKRVNELASYMLRNIKPALEMLVNIQGGNLEQRLVDFADWVSAQNTLDEQTIINKLTEVSDETSKH